MITQSELKELLHYSVITGQFYWLKSTAIHVKVGDVAGALNLHGYVQIGVKGKRYPAHRLAWFWVTGEWAKADIDHENRVRDANYWLNIREATRSQNMCNTEKYSTNTSGFKGVTWNKVAKKWQAQIVKNKKQKHLGLFCNVKDAYIERLKAEKELHKDFANTKDELRDIEATYKQKLKSLKALGEMVKLN